MVTRLEFLILYQNGNSNLWNGNTHICHKKRSLRPPSWHKKIMGIMLWNKKGILWLISSWRETVNVVSYCDTPQKTESCNSKQNMMHAYLRSCVALRQCLTVSCGETQADCTVWLGAVDHPPYCSDLGSIITTCFSISSDPWPVRTLTMMTTWKKFCNNGYLHWWHHSLRKELKKVLWDMNNSLIMVIIM